jgi:hypothetical protein
MTQERIEEHIEERVKEHIEIRVSGPGSIEDHHAHLLRLHYLDRCLHFSSGNDDRAIDAHCLRLLSARAVLLAAYVDGTQRAAVEIIPDRATRHAQAVVTAEIGYQSHPALQALIVRAAEEACKLNLTDLAFHGVDIAPAASDDQIARSA